MRELLLVQALAQGVDAVETLEVLGTLVLTFSPLPLHRANRHLQSFLTGPHFSPLLPCFFSQFLPLMRHSTPKPRYKGLRSKGFLAAKQDPSAVLGDLGVEPGCLAFAVVEGHVCAGVEVGKDLRFA